MGKINGLAGKIIFDFWTGALVHFSILVLVYPAELRGYSLQACRQRQVLISFRSYVAHFIPGFPLLSGVYFQQFNFFHHFLYLSKIRLIRSIRVIRVPSLLHLIQLIPLIRLIRVPSSLSSVHPPPCILFNLYHPCSFHSLFCTFTLLKNR